MKLIGYRFWTSFRDDVDNVSLYLIDDMSSDEGRGSKTSSFSLPVSRLKELCPDVLKLTTVDLVDGVPIDVRFPYKSTVPSFINIFKVVE